MMRALVLVLGLLAAIHSAAAADGRALVVAGQVMLERVSIGTVSSTALAAGTEIRSGDLIRTGSDGRVQIRFSDGSIVALQPDTAFRIDEYRYERDERRAFFFLLRGALRTMTGVIGKTNHDAEYRMKTPTATVGVRGTEYVAEQTVCDPRCSPGSRAGLRVAVTQGRIALITNAGAIDVDAGGSAAAESDDAAPQPTERGPVLPPISLTQPRERTASAAAAGNAPSAGSPASKAASREATPSQPAAASSSGETEGSTPDLRATDPLDVSGAGASDSSGASADSSSVEAWPRFAATSYPPAAWVSPNERRDSEGALLSVVDLLERPAGALSPGVRVIDPRASGTGLALRVLDPWRIGIGPTVGEGSVELDGDIRLIAFEWCRSDARCHIGKGNTNVAEAGHDAWTSWGRWTSGRAVATPTDSPLLIPGNEGLHYLVGVPSSTVPTSGVFGYQLIGSTQATLSPGSTTGIFGGSVAVAFSPSGARVGIDANVAFPNGAYRFATPGGIVDPARSTLATGPGHAFGGELTATGTNAPLDCAASCPVRVDGGLFGPDAARVGIAYRITGSGDGSTISGVGVFGKKSP